MILTKFSIKEDGSFRVEDSDPTTAPSDDALARRRAAFAPGRWTWLRQVHGAEVKVVTEPGDHAGSEADAAVTTVPGATLAVHTADCVPVLLADAERGVIGAAHAGWRGLLNGVLEGTVEAMERLGAHRTSGVMGPHIRGHCYEFGEAELDRVIARYGSSVRATTAAGTCGLDLSAAVRAALGTRDVEVVDAGGCTACEPERFFSHRARREDGRHASIITLVEDAG